jgi:outer membrane protein TolC
MKRYHFFILFIIASFNGMNAQNAFSLEDAVNYAIKNHSANKLNDINVADAEQNMRELRSIGLPQLSGKVGYNYFIETPSAPIGDFLTPAIKGILIGTGVAKDYPEINDLKPREGGTLSFQQKNNFSAAANLSWMVFDGSYLVALEAAKGYKELTHLQTEITPNQLRNTVTEAYYAVLLAQKNVATLDSNIANLKVIRDELAAIYKQGLNEKLDVDRIDLSVATLRSAKSNLERSIELMKDLLKFQMQYPADQPITLTSTFDEIYQQADINGSITDAKINMTDRPEYNVLMKTNELLGLDLKRYKMAYWPTLVLIGSFERTFQSDNIFKPGGLWLPSSLVGAQLSIPIFDGYDKSAKKQRARLSIEKNLVTISDFERGIKLALTTAQNQYLIAKENIKSRQQTLDLANEIFKVIQIKYKQGVGSSLEERQAEADVYAAQNSLLQAQYDLIKAYFEIEKALGKYNF